MILTILILKTVSIIVGFSSAIINDLLTLRFLKDFKITKDENKILQSLAGVTLFSLLTLSISFILSMYYKMSYINNEILLSSGILLMIVVLNEIIFRRIIVSKLAVYRVESNFMEVNRVVFLRRLAFSLNLISIISWIYLLLIFQFSLNDKIFTSEIILGDYILISSVAVILLNIIYNLKSR